MADRVRNWKAITAMHKKRGAMLTIIFDESQSYATAPARTGKRGRPFKFNDALIEGLLMLKVLLRLSLRALQGFVQSLLTLNRSLKWKMPDYSTLSRRMAALEIDLEAKIAKDKRHVFMVDSTGLKVFGEGEWKVRQHGVDKRRTWRKMHILVDRESGHICNVSTTDNNVHDTTAVPQLLPDVLKGDFLLGDGAYHNRPLHRLVFSKGGVLLSPPARNARPWKPHHYVKDEAALRFRNSQLTHLQHLGRKAWKIKSGCSKRSYVESVMHRFKSITGAHLSSRTFDRQVVEVRLRCKALNATATSTWSAPA